MISKLHLSKFRNFKIEKVDFSEEGVGVERFGDIVIGMAFPRAKFVDLIGTGGEKNNGDALVNRIPF